MKLRHAMPSLRAHSRLSRGAAVGAGLLAAAGVSFAQDTTIAGGRGGQPFALYCDGGPSTALVGIRGREGSYVDRVQGVCVQVNFDGTWQGNTFNTGSAGGSGGNAFTLTCARDRAITAITGRAGIYVDKLKVGCARIGPEGRITGDVEYLGGVAGSPGNNNFGELSCRDGNAARAIIGRAGIYVDAIGLRCSRLTSTLRVSSVDINPSTRGDPDVARVGQVLNGAVRMSSTPAATATVNLASRDIGIATVAPATVIGTNGVSGIAAVTPRAPGCTRITASYKGSTASRALLVHSAARANLLMTTPDGMLVRRVAGYPVSVTIPNGAPSGGTRVEFHPVGDNLWVTPAAVTIPAGSRSAQVLAFSRTVGCALLKATGNGAEATHAISIYPRP